MLKIVSKIALVAALAMPVVVSAEAPKVDANATKEVKIDTARLNAAKDLVASMGIKDSYAKMIDQATQGLVLRQPKLKSVEGEIKAFYTKYIGWDTIKDKMAAIYAKHYTVKELNELKDFYKSDIGQKSIKLMPQIMQEGQKLGASSVMAHADELKAIISKALAPKKEETKK